MSVARWFKIARCVAGHGESESRGAEITNLKLWWTERNSDSEQIFDPSTGLWSVPLNTPGIAWARPSCVLLNDGRTLVFEGARAQLFDPISETWTATGVLFTYAAQSFGVGVYNVSTGQWRALPEPVLSGVAMFSGDEYLLVSKSPQRLVVGQ